MTSNLSNNLVHPDDIPTARIVGRNYKDCSVELVMMGTQGFRLS